MPHIVGQPPRGRRPTAMNAHQTHMPALPTACALLTTPGRRPHYVKTTTTPFSLKAAQAAQGSHSLGPRRLQVRLTLFPKCFPPFPHGTCILSRSGAYAAPGGTYLLNWRSRPRERDSKEQKPVTSCVLLGMGISPVPWHLSRHRPAGRSLTWLLDSTMRDFVALLGVCNTLFIRHYFEGASWCLFRRLLICLNSASDLLCGRVGSSETRGDPWAATILRHPSRGDRETIASANTSGRRADCAHTRKCNRQTEAVSSAELIVSPLSQSQRS